MKKHFSLITTFIAFMTVLICSCGDPAVTINYDVSGSGSIPEFKSNTIIKNKVVNLNESTDVYYEYFEFTTATTGNYFIYKDVDGVLSAQTTIKLDGSSYDVPSTFTFDSTTGKISSTINSSEVHSYLFNVAGSYAVASELLTTAAETKSSVFNKWAADNLSIQFENDGTAVLIAGYSSYKKGYSNNGGWIIFDGTVPFFYGKFDSDYYVYYLAYKTERSEVESVGKALSVNNSLNFTGNQFILLK